MPDLLMLVPTETLSIDASSNRLSLFHVVEQVNIVHFPVVMHQICVVTLWQRRRDEAAGEVFYQTIDLKDPDDMSLCPPRRADFKLERKRHRLICIFANVPIHRAGQHQILLYCHPKDAEMPDEKYLLRKFPIEVQQVQPVISAHPPASEN